MSAKVAVSSAYQAPCCNFWLMFWTVGNNLV